MLGISGLLSMQIMEYSIERKSFFFRDRSPFHLMHEVVVVVKPAQNDLKSLLEQLSTPTSTKYQQWLSFEEVGTLVQNPSSQQYVRQWLVNAGATILSQSKHGEYIRASAPIKTWEEMLNTTFYLCEDHKVKGKLHHIHRAKHYYLPLNLQDHVAAILNTVQVPPIIFNERSLAFSRGKTQIPFKSTSLTSAGGITNNFLNEYSGSVNIRFLNELYGVKSNIGDKRVSQAVIETGDENFSPADLTLFQRTYNVTRQQPFVKFGHNVSDCSLYADLCGEGNMDTQYIMGMAQRTTTYYWYSSYIQQDPFLAWILDVANDTNPPQSNSISWGADEQVRLYSYQEKTSS